MSIHFSDTAVSDLDETLLGKDIDLSANSKLQYLIQQIEFYSDLCLSRNYLWNKKMETLFPLGYIIK
jgi:hypothetical protein